MTFTASDVLLKAASFIEEEGRWCQGEMFAGRATCALGAIWNVATELGVKARDAEDLFERHLEATTPDTYSPLRPAAAFNDTPGRTAAEVAEAMRRAAVECS